MMEEEEGKEIRREEGAGVSVWLCALITRPPFSYLQQGVHLGEGLLLRQALPDLCFW